MNEKHSTKVITIVPCSYFEFLHKCQVFNSAIRDVRANILHAKHPCCDGIKSHEGFQLKTVKTQILQ